MLTLLATLVLQTPTVKADAAVAAFLQKHKIVGVSAAVFAGDRQVYFGTAGYADRERKKAVTQKTFFRLGSVSKPVTAVAAMKLVEDSKLNLDADCKTWIPEWPNDRPKTTLRNFLTHTSGVRHYNGFNDPNGKTFYPTAAGAAKLFVNDKLLFTPGAKYSYSTHAYTLVARAMEKATGVSYVQWMRSAVFPFAKTGLDCELLSQRKDRAALYGLANGEAKLDMPPEDNSWKFAGGGMEATGPGLGRFFNELIQVRILSPESLRQMWSSTKLNDGSFSNYGIGFGLGKNNVVSHNGSQQGCRSAILIDIPHKIVAVVLTNTQGSFDPGDLTEELVHLLFAPQ